MINDKDRCPGCGVFFQKETPGAAGYLPEGKVPDGKTLCQRCFQMRHYGVFKKATIKDRAIKEDILEQVKDCAALFLVVDICQFEVSAAAVEWVQDLNKPVFLVVNKCDMVKNWISQEDITRWVSLRLSIKESQIIPMSARDRQKTSDLRRKIEDTFHRGEKILLLGTTNVGKSTLLSALTGSDIPVTSRLPGTTMGIIIIRGRSGKVSYVDAPGLKESNPWLSRLCPTCLANLIPKKQLKNTIGTMKPGQIMSLGGLGWLEILDCGERGWIKAEAFFSDEINVHLTNAEKMTELVHPYRSDIFSLPCPSCWDSLNGPDYEPQELSMHVNQDLVIPGCGWIALRSGNFSGRIFLPDGVRPIIRPSLIPSEAVRKRALLK